ncbi:hypothetical protein CEXT_231461 [Caerostris extrusa]|uniref:Uncharacterized protein n=1 Tax=Caerostris extrusa TaxID=172846 RepID=A0AAV4RBY2_CAEEX|nr:hypothetical protein CEXT_231461 [Caerostris extrusa]
MKQRRRQTINAPTLHVVGRPPIFDDKGSSVIGSSPANGAHGERGFGTAAFHRDRDQNVRINLHIHEEKRKERGAGVARVILFFFFFFSNTLQKYT